MVLAVGLCHPVYSWTPVPGSDLFVLDREYHPQSELFQAITVGLHVAVGVV